MGSVHFEPAAAKIGYQSTLAFRLSRRRNLISAMPFQERFFFLRLLSPLLLAEEPRIPS
jgi:hypothetical protein